jgi:hypothetical protein
MTVEDMLNKISSTEIAYWRAYAALENEEYEWERKKAQTKRR